MSVYHVTGSVNEVPDVSSKFSYPDSVGSSACCETARVVSVDVRILVIAKSVDFVGNRLVYACCGVDAVHELAGERLAVALAGREIVVVMVKAGVETRVCGRDA